MIVKMHILRDFKLDHVDFVSGMSFVLSFIIILSNHD